MDLGQVIAPFVVNHSMGITPVMNQKRATLSVKVVLETGGESSEL